MFAYIEHTFGLFFLWDITIPYILYHKKIKKKKNAFIHEYYLINVLYQTTLGLVNLTQSFANNIRPSPIFSFFNLYSEGHEWKNGEHYVSFIKNAAIMALHFFRMHHIWVINDLYNTNYPYNRCGLPLCYFLFVRLYPGEFNIMFNVFLHFYSY